LSRLGIELCETAGTANLSSTTPQAENEMEHISSDDHLQVVSQESMVLTAAAEPPNGLASDDVKAMQEIVRLKSEINNYEAVLKAMKDDIKALNQKVHDCAQVNQDLKNKLSDSISSLDASQREVKKLTSEMERLQSSKHHSEDSSGNCGGGGVSAVSTSTADEPRPVAHVAAVKKLG
jgi:chromosome segregation ATPase